MLESGHTLILGWSDKMLNMIDQLCLANESAGGKAIVILAERDKQDMEEDIHKQIHNLRGSRVLCRSDRSPYTCQSGPISPLSTLSGFTRVPRRFCPVWLALNR